MPDQPSPQPTSASGAPHPGVTSTTDAERRLAELAVLHEFAQLATLARDWDELMRTIVDRTTVAMGVDVCSFYLMDGAGGRLTLVATNGLDRSQVGRVSLPVGDGLTGAAAAERRPLASIDVTVDPRFRWDRVFEAYVRAEGRGRGSGIGLFAARRLMDAMGGRVWLEPNGYGGSRFVITLPAPD